MFYLIIFAILFIVELLYFRIADKFNINAYNFMDGINGITRKSYVD